MQFNNRTYERYRVVPLYLTHLYQDDIGRFCSIAIALTPPRILRMNPSTAKGSVLKVEMLTRTRCH